MEDYQVCFVGNLLAYSVQRDVSPERLCRLSGINPAILKPAATVSITPKQLNDLWLNASHLSSDPLFGLHFGESLQLAALGIVGQIIQTSRTVGEALTHAAEFMHLLTNLFTMTLTQTDHFFTVRFIPCAEHSEEYRFMARHLMDLSMVLVLHEVDGLVLEKIKPQAVTLPYIASDGPEYKRILRCETISKAGEYTLVFNAHYWDTPILTANYELQTVLLQKAASLGNPVGTEPLMKERIGSFLVTNAYLGIPSLETIAANFNTSSRSIQRKLQDEGATYQQVADSIRKTLATTYLESGKYPIKEVSYILGYNELSAFSRAFKRRTGTTPSNYQKR